MESSFHNHNHRDSGSKLPSKRFRSEGYFLGLAKHYKGKELYKEALYSCDQALFHYGESAAARNIKAQCYFSQRQYAQSLSNLKKALEKEPKNLEALDLSIEIHKKLGQKKSASRLMENISRIRSESMPEGIVEEKEVNGDKPFELDFVFATKTVAELYLRQGLKEKAIFVLDTMLKKNSEDVWAKEKLSSLRQNKEKRKYLLTQVDYLNRVLDAIKSERLAALR